jgi:hypothetical protein
MSRKVAEFSYEIKEKLGVLSTSATGWTKELNLISWNGKAARFDLREWSPDHEKAGKGVTLSDEEADALKEILAAKR